MMTILFRTDASFEIGTGHVMRCLALANFIGSHGFECHFICRELSGHMASLIIDSGHNVHLLPIEDNDNPFESVSDRLDHSHWLRCSWQQDAAQSSQIVNKLRPSWLIVDHYALDARWENAVKPVATRLMVIDDLIDRPHCCDILLNQNLGAESSLYTNLVPPGTKLLIGPRYSLLRPEFAETRALLGPPETRPFKNRWLACIGGTDPHDILGKIVQAWKQVPDPKPALRLAVRSNSPNVASLKQRVAGSDIELHLDANITRLMADSDFLICSAGTINWERCCLGIPALFGIMGENQRTILQALVKAQTGVDLGLWHTIDIGNLATILEQIKNETDLLKQAARNSWEVLDGEGLRRMTVAIFLDDMSLRLANTADAHTAFTWRNHPATYKYCNSPTAIAYETHELWWSKALTNANLRLLIAEIGGLSLGVLRFDIEGYDAIVSIYVDPTLTQLGIGPRVLKAGIKWCKENLPSIELLLADILPENQPSQVAFQRAGFFLSKGRWVLDLSKDDTIITTPQKRHRGLELMQKDLPG